MATIRQRNGKWAVQIRKQGHRTLHRTFSSKAMAQKWARRTEADIESHEFMDAQPAATTTLGHLLNRYRIEVLPSKRSLRPVTSQIGKINDALGPRCLLTLTPADIATFRDQRLDVVGPETVRKDLLLISRVIHTAMKDWGIYLPHGNPIKLVRLPTPPSGRERRLEKGEETQLMRALRYSPEVQKIVVIAIETAMRRKEIVNLTWNDLDRESRVLSVRQTKTGRPRRVPLTSRALNAIDRQPRGQGDSYIFATQPGSVSQAFARACKRAGLQDLRFHDLRHEATSRLFEKGLNPMEVATITGHQDLRMLRRYTHLRAEDLLRKLEGY